MARTPLKNGNTSSNGTSLTFDLVKGAAMGRWADIATSVYRIPSQFLTGEHTECPKCGGLDRFRVFDDFAKVGGAICNKCARDLGDGFKLGDWYMNCAKFETLRRVAEFLGIDKTAGRGPRLPKADPAEHLIWQPWSDMLVGLWCLTKPPVTPAALYRCGARIALYRQKYTVIALPVWGEKLTTEKPVGWSLYNISGGTLPKFTKVEGDKPKVEQVKVKLTYGSQPGLIGPVDELADASHVWKLEGPSDLLSFYSLPDIADAHVAVSNANGAGEKIGMQWMVKLFTDKTVYTLHDADQPGERGASGYRDEKGKWHPGWASEAARYAAESRQLALPYEIAADHGKDLRDWMNGITE